jgi:hypothetical protein
MKHLNIKNSKQTCLLGLLLILFFLQRFKPACRAIRLFSNNIGQLKILTTFNAASRTLQWCIYSNSAKEPVIFNLHLIQDWAQSKLKFTLLVAQ